MDPELPALTRPNDGCAVDWSWLEGREVASAWSDLQSLKVAFRDGQTLEIKAALYQGAPFLSFTPWRPMPS